MSDLRTRKTGFYWVELNNVIGGGWEVAHWSASLKNWQISGRTNNYREDEMVQVDENRLTHKGYEE